LNTLPVFGTFTLVSLCSTIPFKGFLTFFYCVIGVTVIFPNFLANVAGLGAPLN